LCTPPVAVVTAEVIESNIPALAPLIAKKLTKTIFLNILSPYDFFTVLKNQILIIYRIAA